MLKLLRSLGLKKGQKQAQPSIEPTPGNIETPEIDREREAEVWREKARQSRELILGESIATLSDPEQPDEEKLKAVGYLWELNDARGLKPIVDALTNPQIGDAVSTKLALHFHRPKEWIGVADYVGDPALTEPLIPFLDEVGHRGDVARAILRHVADEALGGRLAASIDRIENARRLERAEGERQFRTELHPTLRDETVVRAADLDQLVGVLREYLTHKQRAASHHYSTGRDDYEWPAHLRTTDHRDKTASIVGTELYRRGGMSLMKTVLDERLDGDRNIDMWWSGIAEWRG